MTGKLSTIPLSVYFPLDTKRFLDRGESLCVLNTLDVHGSEFSEKLHVEVETPGTF